MPVPDPAADTLVAWATAADGGDARPSPGIVRTVLALTLVSAVAPLLFGLLLFVSVLVMSLAETLAAGPRGPAVAKGSDGQLGELIGIFLIPVILGGPVAGVAGLAVGLPGIWQARRLRLTSLPALAAGGAALALGCAAWFAREDILALRFAWLADGFMLVVAATGAASGALYWLLAERPRRSRTGV